MKSYIGIDGGGSTTRMFIQADDQEPAYFEFPVSLKVRNGDFARSASTLRNILQDDLSLDTQSLAIAIGLAGMSREENQDALKNAIRSPLSLGGAVLVHVEGDATLALNAALSHTESGVLLIAGTGSVAYARSKDGTLNRVGGLGPETSDEGSGYWIGLRGLRHYLRMLISTQHSDAFSIGVSQAFPANVSSPREIANLLEHEPLFPATLAPIVFEYEDRSEVARSIIEQAAESLSGMVMEISAGMERPVPVHLSGSVARHPKLIAELQGHLPAEAYELLILAEAAPARKAVEIARGLQRIQDTERV